MHLIPLVFGHGDASLFDLKGIPGALALPDAQYAGVLFDKMILVNRCDPRAHGELRLGDRD